MTKIVVSTDQAHIYGRADPIPTGQVEFSRLKFLFSSNWDDLTKIVQFKQRESCYNVAMENDECFVPPELMIGKVQVSVRGYPKDSESPVIATANSVTLFVVQGFDSNGTPSVPPTPDLYQKLLSTIQSQIGDLNCLTTKAKENLVAAINEAAKTGSGGAGSIDMQVSGGYIQYSNDGGTTWENLIAVDDLKGKPGEDGAPGTPGEDGKPGADGYSPVAKIEATADGAKITITDKSGTTEAAVKNGKDGADGAPGKDGTDGTNGITPTIGDNGNWYLGTEDTGKPSRGEPGADAEGLPTVTASDNGKFLRVVNGAWAAAEIQNANGEEF